MKKRALLNTVRFVIPALYCLGASGTAPENYKAGYETIVTDSSFSTSSRVVIDEEQIKKAKAPNVTSLLQTQANISIAN